MRTKSDTAHSRREFFRSAGRQALLAVLTVTAAVLVRRSWSQRCLNQGICRGCRVFTDCGLPQALSTRQGLKAQAARKEKA